MNAKVSRPAVCNSLDTILVDEKIAAPFLQQFQPLFEKYPVEIFADHKLIQPAERLYHLQKANPKILTENF